MDRLLGLPTHQLVDIWEVSACRLLKLLWSFTCKLLYEHMLLIFLGVYLGVELLGHRIALLNLLRSYQIGFQCLHHFTTPSVMCEGSAFSTSSLTLLWCFLEYRHPSGCVKWYLMWFWFLFPFSWWLITLSVFSCAYWLFVYLLWGKIYPDSLPILKLGYPLLWVNILIIWIWDPYQSCDLQILPLILWVVFLPF